MTVVMVMNPDEDVCTPPDDAEQGETMSSQPLLLTTEEAAALAGITRTRLYPFVMSGQITSITLGRRRYIPREAIEAFVREEIERQAAHERLVDAR